MKQCDICEAQYYPANGEDVTTGYDLEFNLWVCSKKCFIKCKKVLSGTSLPDAVAEAESMNIDDVASWWETFGPKDE